MTLRPACPPSRKDVGDQHPDMVRCTPGVMVCNFWLEPGPDGAVYACQDSGQITSFELRGAEHRITGRCENNRAAGDWTYYTGCDVRRIDHYSDGTRTHTTTRN